MNKLAWDKLIVALDVPQEKEIKRIVNELTPEVKKFKIGLIPYTLLGPEIVRWLKKRGAEVFLDLKLYDIPNTMCEAVRIMIDMGVWGITVHVKAGVSSLRMLSDMTGQYADKNKLRRPLLVGVTELTSEDASVTKVFSLAKKASQGNLDAVVCSVWEARQIKNKLNLMTVTPCIRPKNGDDQKRIATVKDALSAKVDYFVVGRPIIQQKNYKAAARRVLRGG